MVAVEDNWNATFFCGSCAVIRRSALEEIGGFAVETVTEDAHTALKMQRLGWGSAFLSIPQEGNAWQAKLEMQHGVEIAKTLLPLQATAKQRVIDAENLCHATRPAGTLNDMQAQTFCCQTGRAGAQPFCRSRWLPVWQQNVWACISFSVPAGRVA